MGGKKTLNQEKTKSQIGFKYLQYFIFVTGAILIFIAPLIHFPFSKENPKIVIFKKELNQKLKTQSNSLLTLRANYDKGLISAKTYIAQSDLIYVQISAQKTSNKKQLSLKIEESRVLGWLTVRSFLIGFGIRVPYLFFSLLISFLIYKINTEDKKLIIVFTFLQIACYTIVLYVLVWCFWYSQDYPLSTYKWAVIGLSGLVATFVVYYISYRELFATKLQRVVNSLSNFIVIGVRKHIKPESKKEYVKDYIEALKNGMK